MTFKPEVTYGFLNDPDDPFKLTVGDIVSGTVANAFFPDSQPLALSVQTLFGIYSPTVVDRGQQTSESAAARIAARTNLEAALRNLLAAVQAESGGSLARLLTTNIPLARNPETPASPLRPETLSFYLFGSPLQLYVQCEAQPSAKVYTCRISTDETNWQWVSSDGKSAIAFSGLPVGVTLYAQMMVKNSVSASEWSDSKPFTIPVSGVSIPKFMRPKGVR